MTTEMYFRLSLRTYSARFLCSELIPEPGCAFATAQLVAGDAQAPPLTCPEPLHAFHRFDQSLLCDFALRPVCSSQAVARPAEFRPSVVYRRLGL